MYTGFELRAKSTRKRAFLEQMDRVVPWAELVALIEPYAPKAGPKGGRPPFAVEKLLRIHFLQQWFGLSDPAVEEALYDTPLLASFVGLDLGVDVVPDESTILNDIFGNTAIYYAIKKNNFELASLIAKSPNFNPTIKFREDDYKDAFDLAVESRCLELALSIFLSLGAEEKKEKMFTLKDNLYATEALLLTCESLAGEKNFERNKETV